MPRTYCPICRTPFDVTDALLGQKGLCVSCGAKFIIAPPDGDTSRDEAGGTTQPFHMPNTPPFTTRSPASEKVGSALAILVGLLTAAAFGWLRYGTVPTELHPWTSFLGRLHPLFVHYPVAWITAIFVLGIFGGVKHSHALRILLWLNLLTCAAGLVAGQCAIGKAEGATLTQHFYAGLAVASFSWVALLLFLRSPEVHTRLYQATVLGAMLSVALAGHLGATLTHGELLDHLPWAAPPEKSTDLTISLPAEPTVFTAVIQPLLQARCVGCHGAEKEKGKLRLDSYTAMLGQGKSGETSIVPADPDHSQCLLRMKLGKDDDDHMPPADEAQCTPAEIDVLTWWVQAGADPKLALKGAPAPPTILSQLTTLAKEFSKERGL